MIQLPAKMVSVTHFCMRSAMNGYFICVLFGLTWDVVAAQLTCPSGSFVDSAFCAPCPSGYSCAGGVEEPQLTRYGMKFQFDSSAVSVNQGDIFSVKLFANSGGVWDLKMWGVDIRYDSSVLTFVQNSFQIVQGSGFGVPLVVSDVPGAVVVSTQMIPGSDTRSMRLHVATFSLSVNAGNVGVMARERVICTVVGMLNSGGNQYVKDEPCQRHIQVSDGTFETLPNPPGYYYSAGTLTALPCPAGYYCLGGQAAPWKCIDCLAGSYGSPICSSTGPAVCQSCTQGISYTSVPNNLAACLSCTVCEAGWFRFQGCSRTSDTICFPCSFVGGYTNVSNAPSCSKCSVCSAGQYVAAVCTWTSDTLCMPCPMGNFCAAGVSAGTACPIGFTCPAGSSAPVSCILPANASFTGYGTGNVSSCPWTCHDGFYSGGTVCSPCPINSWCASGIRYNCPNNTLSPAFSSQQGQCVCAPGYYYLTNGSSSCTVCASGSYCTGGSGGGLITRCASNFTSPPGSSSSSACVCNNPGYKLIGTRCELCNPAEVCFNGTAYRCPDNSTASWGSSALTDCICLPGFSGPDGGVCIRCPANHVCPGGNVRLPCTVNAISPVQSMNASACYCDGGYVGVGNISCTGCPAGAWCWSGILTSCPPNTVSPAMSFSAQNCSCRPGFAGPSCSPCQAGMFSDNSAGSTSVCTTCPVGTYCPFASAAPLVCALPGAYCPAGSSAQRLCPAGSFCASSSVIQPCVQGSYCPEGSTVQVACAAGLYCPNTSVQIQCPERYDCTPGSPHVCAAGYTNYTYSDRGLVFYDVVFTSKAGSAFIRLSAWRQCVLSFFPEGFSPTPTTLVSFSPMRGDAAAVVSDCTDRTGSSCTPRPRISSIFASGASIVFGTGYGRIDLLPGPDGFWPDLSFSSTIAGDCFPCSNSLAANAVWDRVSVSGCGQECKPGFWMGGDTCNPCSGCAAGFLTLLECAAATDTICIACPMGSFCPNTTTQIGCSDGSWCPEGSPSQVLCPEGYFCPDPSTRSACPAGQYCLPGKTMGDDCSLCLVFGQYVSSECSAAADTVCSQCTNLPLENATYTGTGVSASTCPWTCNPGHFLINSSICAACPAHSWCVSGRRYPCPGNSISPPLSASQERCRCSSGYFGNASGPNTNPCSICISGWYCPGGNGDHLIQACPGNFTSPPGSSSVSACVCKPGYRLVAGGRCEFCDSGGVYCFNGSALPCPSNSIASSGASDINNCACLPGFVGRNGGQCSQCPANFVCTGGDVSLACTANAVSPVQSTDFSACYCDRGFHGTGNMACSACPAGAWCSQGILSQCPPNASSPVGSSSIKNCTCKPGYTGPDSASCRPCQAGMFSSAGGKADCIVCPAGAFCPPATATPLVCTMAGAYCPSGSAAQDLCPAGSFCPDASAVIQCNRTFFCPSGSTSNVVCPAGSFCPNASTRIFCSPGSTCPSGSAAQVPCPLGAFCPYPSLENRCSSGQWCPTGSTVQAPCPAGFFCPDPSSKIPCPADQYCPQGATAGINCSAAVCPVGQFVSSVCSAATDTGCSWCTNLPAHAVFTGMGSSATTCPWMCRPGYLLEKRSACLQCPANAWCIEGAVVLCPGNTISPALSTSPDQCRCAPGWEEAAVNATQ